MDLLRAEKIAEIENNSDRRCRVCDKQLMLVRAILNMETVNLIHLFECECGERIWND